MKKWQKRLGIVVATLVGVFIGLALVCWMLLRGTPQWYRPHTLSGPEQEAAAQSAQNKLILLHNAAVQARAEERAAHRTATTLPAGSAITVSFTDDEVNALLDKWSVWPIVKAGYERFMTDPCIVIENGRLILAGHVKELNSVASLHFTPHIDENGRLKVELTRILAGNLPVPEALLGKYQSQAANAIDRRMPWWKAQAMIDPGGTANSSAVSALMANLFTDVLRDQPSEPALFLPLFDRSHNIAVKVLDVKVADHTLTLTVQPMNPDERAELLKHIRG
ncbi:MAG TPA: hypothetical protein VH518_18970 [Tepidisphaeraceae bacterium]|jgi:hypothetical protein